MAQGNKHGVLATDKIEFIQKDKVPANHDVTYTFFVLISECLKQNHIGTEFL